SANPNPDSGWSQSCFDFHAGGQDMVLRSTLLELVKGVSDYAETDAEIVATIVHLVNSGQVQLCGNFRANHFRSDWEPPSDAPPPDRQNQADVATARRLLGLPERT